MSLHTLASQLQNAGRGEDKVLVHMTPGEVNGLQSLAMAHGGSLTINPHTGLPEAGFLRSFLPMIAGAALAATGVGAPLAAAMVGGGYTLATGSLRKGLMAGLGAYGGAGITGALTSAGAAAAGGSASGAAGLSEAAGSAANSAALDTAKQAAIGSAPSGVTNVAPVATPVVPNAAPTVPGAAVNTAGVTPNPTWANNGASTINQVSYTPPPKAEGLGIGDTVSKNLGDTWGGAKKLFSDSTEGEALRSDLWKNHRGAIMSAGLSALSGMTPEMPKEKDYGTWDPNYHAYSYYPLGYRAPGSTAERTYFAEGGLMGLAAGGPVEQLAQQNMMGRQQGFPMAQQQNNAYTVSSSMPLSGEVLSSGVDTPVNPYTGETRFATGGDTTTTTTSGIPTTSKKKEKIYTPKYQGFDYTTGQFIPVGSPAPGASTTPANATQVASIYNDIYGRPPTLDQLKSYQGTTLTPQQLKEQLMGTDEYLTRLTKPFIPVPQRDPNTGLVSIEGAINPPQTQSQTMADFYAKLNAQLATQMENPTAGYQFAGGGMSHLGDYSDGGRLLRGPGDGVSDSIPAQIGNRQPARLADGEFVVPARIVSELGNGSTEAGARKLYAMMDRVQKARSRSVGKNKVAVNTRADKYLPA